MTPQGWNKNHILSTAKIESNSYKKNNEIINFFELIKNVSESIPGLRNNLAITFENNLNFFSRVIENY